MEEQLRLLGTLLPDLIAKLPRMKAALLLALVKDTQVKSPACPLGNMQSACSCAQIRMQARQHGPNVHGQEGRAELHKWYIKMLYAQPSQLMSCVSGSMKDIYSAALACSQELKATDELIWGVVIIVKANSCRASLGGCCG